MKYYPYLFFDLDGTLTDSGPGIMNSIRYAMEKSGREIPGPEVLRRFIGPPLLESFQKYTALGEDEARQCIALYREYFSVTGLFENAVYPGIPALLSRLRAAGRRLAVATGKPEVYARRILEHFGLAGEFERIAGASFDETRNSKEAVIRYALEGMGLDDPAQVLMVGDREHDVLGARRCGMDCLGVLFGYGSREELERAGAIGVARTVEEIGDLVLDAEI